MINGIVDTILLKNKLINKSLYLKELKYLIKMNNRKVYEIIRDAYSQDEVMKKIYFVPNVIIKIF